MALDANTGQIISKKQAKDLIKAYDIKFPGEVISSFIGANNVKNILAQEGCIGIKIYNGYDDQEQKIKLVLVGVNEDEEEMFEKGIIYDEMATCPPYCSTNEDDLFPKK
ncbi:hypothetical protein OX283_009445 [Flavobacterium sp. SUN052]|uniref:hypothetical protein n=1 Tax=Flavobacterium sp. SUN052 TaxID=3002441 RepID=UPI00237EC8A2|nr:hypothetical protein [Flavobacterium sp. SUN052]MEC4004878.1 hypothetical protein [Flavobacterium sp. SUN052]